MSKTSVGTNSLQSLDILTELVVQTVRGDLAVFAILVVLLSVQKPVRDLVLTRVGHNGHDAVDLEDN